MNTGSRITAADAVRHLIVCDTQFTWAGVTNLTMPQMMDLQARGWVVEGDDNNEFQLTEAGEAIVARALQHGAPKTLADAQPGGAMGLGDQAERVQFEAWAFGECLSLHRYDSGAYSHDRTLSAWLAWQAALAAQPSPAGQGDALVTDAMVQAALARYLQLEPSEAQNNPMDESTAQFMRQLLEAALAARQPVGEAIGEIVYSDEGGLQIEFYDGKPLAPMKLYAAPPAQAVDLGPGLDAAASLIQKKADDYADEHGYDDMGALSFGRGHHAEVKSDHHFFMLELVDELRALIDKAVGNGTDR